MLSLAALSIAIDVILLKAWSTFDSHYLAHFVCSKLEGLADDMAEEFECLLATGVGDLERLACGVVDLDVLLLAGDKSVSSDSDARLILACRAFARAIFFSRTHFSSSNCMALSALELHHFLSN